MRLLATACALALLNISPQAGAADVTQLNCALSSLTPELRAGLQSVMANSPSPTAPAMVELRNIINQCASAFVWSTSETEAVTRYTIASVGQTDMRRQLAGDGIDVGEIEQAMLTDNQLVAAMRSPQFTYVPVNEFATRRLELIERALGTHAGDPEYGRRIGTFMIFRAVMEAERFRFAGN
jgi:hypothetical protein